MMMMSLLNWAFLKRSRERELASELEQASPGLGCVQLPDQVPPLQLIELKNAIVVQVALLLPGSGQVDGREEQFWCFCFIRDGFHILFQTLLGSDPLPSCPLAESCSLQRV